MHFLTFILRNLTRRPTRTALTVLGLAVAVGSMVALFGITTNVREAVEASFERRRIDLVVQQAGRTSGLNSDFREYLVHEAEAIAWFKLTTQALERLHRDGVPEAVIGKLRALKDKEFLQTEFERQLAQILSGEDKTKYFRLISDCAIKVKLTDQSIEELKKDRVPETVLVQLNELKNKEYSLAELKKHAGKVLQTAEKDKYIQAADKDRFLNLIGAHAERVNKAVAQVAWAVVNLIDVTKDSGYSDQIIIQGMRPDNFAFEDLDMLTGRKLDWADERKDKNDLRPGKVMLGSTLAANLNKKEGDTVVFGTGERYEVVGIFKSDIVFEKGGAIVPLEDGRRLTSMQVTGFSVRIAKHTDDPEAEVEAVKQQIESLRDPEDQTVRLIARSPASYTDSLAHMKMIRAIAWIVSVIAVIIGVIGLLNTMAMSVLERTQEIGILRAVGWPPRRVIRMIMGEATLLSLAAAAAGTVTAAVGMYVLTLSPKVNGFIEGGLSLAVIVKGFGVTLLIGLLGGVYPAFRAARLLPTEAIRHD